MWLNDYKFDGLRFDAVHAIENDDFLDAMAAELREKTTGRHVHLVLENEGNDADRLHPAAFDAQWNDDFHNVLHVLLTGETSAYYSDFADRPAERLARCLGEGFIYQGEGSPNHDGKPRGKPSAHLSPTAFVAFLQNRDQIGNRAMGERLTLLTDRQKLRAATALLLLGPQIPLLFMGDEQGSESPFLFFTDFHDESRRCGARRAAQGIRQVRRVRRSRSAQGHPRSQRARDVRPVARASRPGCCDVASAVRHAAQDPPRGDHPSVTWHDCNRCGSDRGGAVVARWRMGDDAVLTIALNLGDEAVAFPVIEAAPIFADGDPGQPDSIAVWLAR
ncbi:DUF3459 domain-containing protein [Sphingomonas aurantiaca]|uniref:DUF3459 domain-containing protein n=1 Tax=Sphingomonas aurantiaca TaxID=185949 RepID=UPI002FE0CAF8